jgi:hypothetical protein
MKRLATKTAIISRKVTSMVPSSRSSKKPEATRSGGLAMRLLAPQPTGEVPY